MITIALMNYRVEGDLSDPPQKFELLLHIVADICVRCGEDNVYEDESFPIVELAWRLEQWLLEDHPCSFEFYSMESDDGPLLCFAYVDGSYSFSSIHQSGECRSELDYYAIRQAVRALCSDIRNASVCLTGIDAVEAMMS
jgi:hypothetical protein